MLQKLMPIMRDALLTRLQSLLGEVSVAASVNSTLLPWFIAVQSSRKQTKNIYLTIGRKKRRNDFDTSVWTQFGIDDRPKIRNSEHDIFVSLLLW